MITFKKVYERQNHLAAFTDERCTLEPAGKMARQRKPNLIVERNPLVNPQTKAVGSSEGSSGP